MILFVWVRQYKDGDTKPDSHTQDVVLPVY